MRQALGLVWQVAAIVPLQIHSTVGSCSLFSMTSTVDRALHPYADKQSGFDKGRNQSMSAFPCLQSRWTLERCSNGDNTTESEVWYL